VQLPPGFRAQPAFGDPWPQALRVAESGEPGTVLWDDAWGRCRAAFLFAPDPPLLPADLGNLGLLALYDALASLAPAQIPLLVVLPDAIVANAGRVATVRAAAGPDWGVLGIDLVLDLQSAAPGDTPGRTCLVEEGFGPVTAAEALALICHTLLRGIDRLQEDGPAAIASRVAQRTASACVIV